MKVLKLAENSTINFISEYNLQSNDELGVINLVKSKYDKITNSQNIASFRTASSDNLYEDSLKFVLSAKQIIILDELNTIMSDNDNSLASLNERIRAVEVKVLSTLPENEQAVILCATSVAKHTLEYWNEHLVEWEQLLGDEYSPSDNVRIASINDISWKEVGKADVAGAVGGAIRTGAVVLFTGPVEWGTWAASITGVAAASSAGSAILQAW